MSLPARVLTNGDHVYYGYGSDSESIEYVTSEHERGKEPCGIIYLFGRKWIAQSGWYVHGGVARLQWVPLD